MADETESAAKADLTPERGGETIKFELKKKIGIWSAIGLLAGTMVGSGIFVSPAGVLQGVNGSVGLSLVLWAACGVLAMLASLCYAELGTRISESGADFAYHRVAYGKPVGFLYAWTSILMVRSTSNAATSLSFGIYLAGAFYPGCQPPDVVVKCSASLLLLSITVLNCWSVKASTKLQNFFTAAKFLAMVIVIAGGLSELARGNPVGETNFENSFDSDALAGLTFTQIGLAFYQGLFSYDGWNNLNYVTEEVKESHRNIPRAIMVAVPLVTGFYILVNVAYFSVLSPAELMSSQAVAITFGHRVLGSFAWIMPLTVCLSTAGSLNGSYMSGGRMPFVAARAGQWPSLFEMVHVEYYTPSPSLFLNTAISLAFMIPSNFDTMLYAFSFTAWTFYGLSAAAVIVLRFTRKDLPRPYKVPIVIPIIVTLAATYLVIAPIVDSPDLIYLYAFIFIISGLIFYYPLIHKNYTIPGTEFVTTYGQLIFNAAPTDWEEQYT